MADYIHTHPYASAQNISLHVNDVAGVHARVKHGAVARTLGSLCGIYERDAQVMTVEANATY